MIFLFCPNTAIDVRIQIDEFSVGSVIRSKDSANYPSGKAVNSAYCLRDIGANFRAFVICGKFDGDLYAGENFDQFGSRIYTARGETRRNITLLQENRLVVHIQNDGYSVDSRLIDAVHLDILHELKSGDILVVSGSLPRGYGQSALVEFVSRADEAGCHVIYDGDLQYVKSETKFSVLAIKPNISELRSVLTDSSTNALNNLLADFFEKQVKNVIISGGKNGVLCFSSDGSHHFVQPAADVVGQMFEAVGSGDAFVGAFAYGYQESESVSEAARFGAAAGHANVLQHGPGRIGTRYPEILEKTQVVGISKSEAIAKVVEWLGSPEQG